MAWPDTFAKRHCGIVVAAIMGYQTAFANEPAPVAQLDRALPSEGKRKLFLLNISARKIE